MNWRDFFYFSKGERRAFILLLILITVAWLVLIFTEKKNPSGNSSATFYPVCIYLPDKKNEAAVPSPSETLVQPKKTESSLATRANKKSPHTQKYPKGTIIELNSADTTILKKIPGIGSAFSNRIVKYRNLLGGFYSVNQLSEVYGIDEDKYNALKEWFCVNPQLIRKKSVNRLPVDSLARHPYINYKQAKVIKQLCRQKGKLTEWSNLELLEEFAEEDRIRIGTYLSFE